MIPINILSHQNAIKTLYSKCVEEVCVRHQITRMELDVLLFLANNPCYDTATEIVDIRYLSKSQVSSSVKLLENKGYLRREYSNNNRKTAHLKICPSASEIICDGQTAQEHGVKILLSGFSQEEMALMKEFSDRIWHNVNSYFEKAQEEELS